MSAQSVRSARHQMGLWIARVLPLRNHELNIHEVLSSPVDDGGIHDGPKLPQSLRIHVPSAVQVDTDRCGRIELAGSLDLRGEHLGRLDVETPGDVQVDGVPAYVGFHEDRDLVCHGATLQSNRRNEFLDLAQRITLPILFRNTSDLALYSLARYGLAEGGLTPANPEPKEAP